MAADLTMLPISSTNALPANSPPPSSLPPDRRRFHTRVLHFIRLQPRAACDTACDTARMVMSALQKRFGERPYRIGGAPAPGQRVIDIQSD